MRTLKSKNTYQYSARYYIDDELRPTVVPAGLQTRRNLDSGQLPLILAACMKDVPHALDSQDGQEVMNSRIK